MAVNRIQKLLRLRAAAMILAAAATSPPAPAAAGDQIGFCPADYRLWGALCMNATTGDVVKPETSGPAYQMRKAGTMGRGLCASWDVHITTQIGDFGATGAVPANRLEKAGLLQNLARALCREDRFAEGVDVYETIFAGID